MAGIRSGPDDSPSSFSEDLLETARETFELAHELCGPCRDYHALRPYLRLVGLVQGMQRHGAGWRTCCAI